MPTTRRPAPRSAATSSSGSAPLTTASLLVVALAYGVGTLVSHGQMKWPPTQLLASLYTVAGCLAIVGPILLLRKDADAIGVGELIWTVGGLVIWVFDAAALARGDTRTLSWATPLAYQPMGLTMLAVGAAAWRSRSGSTNWSWSNVTGWALGIFWVAMAAITLLPPRTLGLALR